MKSLEKKKDLCGTYKKYAVDLQINFEKTLDYANKTAANGKSGAEYLSKVFANLGSYHPDDMLMAGRIKMHQLHESTPDNFKECIMLLHGNKVNGKSRPLISDDLYKIVKKHHETIQKEIRYDRDFKNIDYLSYNTLYKSYLMRLNHKVVERPQHLWMRVALAIHLDDLKRVFETYHALSEGYFTHATPTLFNAGTNCGQLSSCFLVCMEDDSIEGIYNTLKKLALISKDSGGIGFTTYKIRASGSYIAGTNGKSNGIIPMLKVFDVSAKYVDQGGGKRKGAWAVYQSPWHADYLDWLELKKNTGKDDLRARDLFYASWISDLFMKRVHNDEIWSFFCPTDAPNLLDTYGDEFEKWYKFYEGKKLYKKQMNARKLFNIMCYAIIEYSGCYVMWKDAVNRRNPQMNAGIIRSSNLCTEIVQHTSPKETAVCNLASIALPKCVTYLNGSINKHTFDFNILERLMRIAVRNLDLVIDRTSYPTKEARTSNLRHRPMGIGIQGLCDVFQMMGLVFGDKESTKLNREIFECMYWTALDESSNIAKEKGSYLSFDGSPASKGILQFDMCTKMKPTFSGRFNWKALKKKIKTQGLRNSMFIAPMPTGSTSTILRNIPCFENPHGNIFMKVTLSGTFNWVNKWMIRDFEKLGIMSDDLMEQIAHNGGSVQGIDKVPKHYQKIYRTAFEIPTKTTINMAIERNCFIDQSQSMSFFKEGTTVKQLRSMLVHTWKSGLKNGIYYFRSKPTIKLIGFKNGKFGTETLKTSSTPNSPIIKKDSGFIDETILNTKNTSLTLRMKKKIAFKKKWECRGDEGCTMCGS